MIEVAKEAAIKAGEAVLKLRNKVKVKLKSNESDIVTQADLASEELILNTLKSSFPNYNYVSEEIGKENNNSDFTWVIDPIDGTLCYAGGLPFYGISIGLLKDNKPHLGVINLPAFNSIYWAEEGKGAYFNGKRIKVSTLRDVSKSIVIFDYHFAGTRQKDINKILIKLVDKVRYTPTFACSVVSLTYVAQGICHANIHTAFPWDFAAGAAIITEAGGKVTDFEGKIIDWFKNSIDMVASNSYLHKKILELIK